MGDDEEGLRKGRSSLKEEEESEGGRGRGGYGGLGGEGGDNVHMETIL